MTRPARGSKPLAPLTPEQIRTIHLAINRWFRNRQGSDRVWQSLMQACGTAGPTNVKGCTPEARLVRQWLKYREIARREANPHSPEAIEQFNQAYALWLKNRARPHG